MLGSVRLGSVITNRLGTDNAVVATAVDAILSAVFLVAGVYVAAVFNLSPVWSGVAGLFLTVVGLSIGAENEFLGAIVALAGVGLLMNAVTGGLLADALKYKDAIAKLVQAINKKLKVVAVGPGVTVTAKMTIFAPSK